MKGKLLVVAFVMALVAAACGDTDGAGETTTEAAPAATEAPAAAADECAPGETDGDFVLYNWSEYIDPELITTFEEEYGVSVTEDFFTSNEELRSKLQAGAEGYDLIVPSDYMVSILKEDGLIQPIDKDAIPNLSNVDAVFLDPPFDPGGEYHVPYQWGTTGIGFAYEALGEDFEPTWGIIFDPEISADFAGQISLLDDARETMGAALKYLGYSLNTTDEAEIQEAADLIAATRERLATFDSDAFEDLLIAGETVVAHGWNGDFFAGYDGASTDDYDAYEDYGYFIPQEGGVQWVDTMALVTGTDHPCSAHAFINFLLEPENGAALTNFNFYASPITDTARDLIEPEILEDTSIYPDDVTLEKLEFIADVGEANALYEQLFAEAQS